MKATTDEPRTDGYIIGKVGLFHTPDSTDDLMDWITQLSNSGERIAATTAAMMCWNLCAEITRQQPPQPFKEQTDEE